MINVYLFNKTCTYINQYTDDRLRCQTHSTKTTTEYIPVKYDDTQSMNTFKNTLLSLSVLIPGYLIRSFSLFVTITVSLKYIGSYCNGSMVLNMHYLSLSTVILYTRTCVLVRLNHRESLSLINTKVHIAYGIIIKSSQMVNWQERYKSALSIPKSLPTPVFWRFRSSRTADSECLRQRE